MQRSALVEAIEQFNRALELIGSLPSTVALRRETIKLQVALITPLLSVKGFGAPETKAVAERARLLIEKAEALGEPPEDPLLLCAVLYGLCTSNYMAFNGDELRNLAVVAPERSDSGQGFPRAAMNSRGERYPSALCG